MNAYMYQPGTSSGQGPQQGPAVPTTTPAYSSYQPTPTQGYQASEALQRAANWDKGWGGSVGLGNVPKLSNEISEQEGGRAGWFQVSRYAALAVEVGWSQIQFWAQGPCLEK